MFVGGNLQVKVGQQLFGQFWVNSGKNPANSQTFPAPTPMIKRDEAEKADFYEIIDEFASIKARNMLF